MSFFDSIPQPPPPEPERWRQPAWMRPDTVIPGSVPAEVLLVRTDRVAVAVGSVCAYPNGFEFTVHVRSRRVDDDFGPSGNPFSWHRRFAGAHAPDDALRLGVLYADGRRTATTSSRMHRDDSSDELVLNQEGGGGDDRSWDQRFWLYPLPPDGPVTLIASWLQRDVTEARAELDGTAIRAAARRAVSLWPSEAEAESSASPTSSSISASKPDDDAGE
jgi:hypothetical protein